MRESPENNTKINKINTTHYTKTKKTAEVLKNPDVVKAYLGE